MMNVVEDFEFLSWLELGMMFPMDMYKNMLEIGISEEMAYIFSRAGATHQGNIVKLYRDYGMDRGKPSDKEYHESFKKYIDFCYQQYLIAKQHKPA